MLSGAQKRKSKSEAKLKKASTMQPSVAQFFKRPRESESAHPPPGPSSASPSDSDNTPKWALSISSSSSSPLLSSENTWRCLKRGLELQYIASVHPVQPQDVPSTGLGLITAMAE